MRPIPRLLTAPFRFAGRVLHGIGRLVTGRR
jgi:hypothetical protein